MGWFGLALPALTVNYLGQAAFILHHPALAHASTFNPFYQMAPRWTLWPMVVLAAVATVIASQAAISGSFSVAKQAVQLGFLPRLRVLHTSQMEGQIYVPVINWALCIGVLALTLVFRSSNKLGDIYGVAVTGTFILNTLLFLAVARLLWGRSKLSLAPIAVLFLTVEVAFFSSNVAKVDHGAWLPLAVGLIMSIVMINWRRGQAIVTQNRMAQEGPLGGFLDGLASREPAVVRVPGVAVFLTRDIDTTPLALREQIDHTHALHEKVVIVSVDTVSIPHVDSAGRFSVELRGRGLFKVFHVTMRVGYRDKLNVPLALTLARKEGLLERNLDLEHASYFVSRITITSADTPGMRQWRKKLFITMARNASSAIDHFGLPGDRTVMMGAQVPL
jgi:KUP system potassium uptake protein